MVAISSGSSGQTPGWCPVCGADVCIPESNEPRFDAPCSGCGSSLFFDSGVFLYAKSEDVKSKVQWLATESIPLMPESVARENVALPLWGTATRLAIGMVDYDQEVSEKIRFIMNRDVQVVLMSKEGFDKLFDEFLLLLKKQYEDGETDVT